MDKNETILYNYCLEGPMDWAANIPDTVTTISDKWMDHGSITSITFPPQVVNFGDQPFNLSRLSEIIIQAPLTEFPTELFYATYLLLHYDFPSQITSTGTSLFGFSGLRSVTLPAGLLEIGYAAFSNSDLISVTVPSTVTSIGSSAFNIADLQTVIMLPTTPPTAGTNIFRLTGSLVTIYVPTGTLSAYQNATNWSQYAAYMEEAI